MTKEKKFKKRVRERAEQTDQSYTSARQVEDKHEPKAEAGLLQEFASLVVRCSMCGERPVTKTWSWVSNDGLEKDEGQSCDECVDKIGTEAGEFTSRDTENAATIREIMERIEEGERAKVLESLPRYSDEETEGEKVEPTAEPTAEDVHAKWIAAGSPPLLTTPEGWFKGNPGLKTVTLTYTHNQHGTPTLHISGPDITSLQFTQPPSHYLQAIRMAYADHEWAKNPRDDLGNLPTCTPEP